MTGAESKLQEVKERWNKAVGVDRRPREVWQGEVRRHGQLKKQGKEKEFLVREEGREDTTLIRRVLEKIAGARIHSRERSLTET